jgi:hypothetical protein
LKKLKKELDDAKELKRLAKIQFFLKKWTLALEKHIFEGEINSS